MTREHRQWAEASLDSAHQWGRGPNAGPTVALIGIGQALLAIHDLLAEINDELKKEEVD